MQSKDRDRTTGTAEELETGYSLKRQDDTEEMDSGLQFEGTGRTQQLKRWRAAYSLKRRSDCPVKLKSWRTTPNGSDVRSKSMRRRTTAKAEIMVRLTWEQL